jgi:Protein of unknown function (DUF2849)
MPSVVTANRLTDGIVVYLAPDGSWTEDIARAARADTEEGTKTLEEQGKLAEKQRIVVAVYPMPVEIKDGEIDPLSVRERIRASHRTTLTKDWYDVPL